MANGPRPSLSLQSAKVGASGAVQLLGSCQNLPKTRKVRVKLNARQVLGHRQYQSFNPAEAPLNFLDAVKRALAACVANQDIEHFWATFRLEWPDAKTRSNVSLRQIPPLDCLVTRPAAEPSAWKCTVVRRKRRVTILMYRSMIGVFRSWKPRTLQRYEKWTCAFLSDFLPLTVRVGGTLFRFLLGGLPSKVKGNGTTLSRRIGASHMGLAASANRNKGAFNGAWSKLYFNHNAGDPEPAMLVAVRQFPLSMDDNNTVTSQEVNGAIKCGMRQTRSLRN